MADGDSVHFVDRHVGARLRALRKDAGMSQGALAQAGGVTFQQVQKYERGSNRISASKLFEFAQTLGVSPLAFYAGLPAPGGGELGDDGQQLATTLDQQMMRVARRLKAVKDPVEREQLAALFERLAAGWS